MTKGRILEFALSLFQLLWRFNTSDYIIYFSQTFSYKNFKLEEEPMGFRYIHKASMKKGLTKLLRNLTSGTLKSSGIEFTFPCLKISWNYWNPSRKVSFFLEWMETLMHGSNSKPIPKEYITLILILNKKKGLMRLWAIAEWSSCSPIQMDSP